MELSIVIPCYNEVESIKPLIKGIENKLDGILTDYNIIVVNDASTDGTEIVLEKMSVNSAGKIEVFNLNKRQGQLKALSYGFYISQSRRIISFDGDLQYDFEDIATMLKELRKGYDAVLGIRRKKNEPFLKRTASFFANVIVRAVKKVKAKDIGCFFNGVNRSLLDRIYASCGKEALITKPLIESYCETFLEMEVKHFIRQAGQSKYSFVDLTRLFWENIS